MAELDPDRATTLIMQATSPTPVRLRLVDGDRAWETIARWERTATGWALIVDLPRVEITAMHVHPGPAEPDASPVQWEPASLADRFRYLPLERPDDRR
jgi:hypothetical protein